MKTTVFRLILSIAVLSSSLALAEIKVDVAKEGMEAKQQSQSWLGIWIEKLPVSLSQHLSSMLQEGQGLIIKQVAPDSPALKAGLLPYDIIIKIDEQAIFTEQQLVEIITNIPAGSTVKLELIRQGKLLTQEAIVMTSPNQRAIPYSKPIPTPPPSLRRTPPTGTGFPYGLGNKPFTPWMNEPFFKRQFERMQQQLNQLHYQQQLQQKQQQQMSSHNSWSEFESIQVQSSGGGKQRAEVKYKDGDGNIQEFTFAGTYNEIRQQIMSLKEMDDRKKQSLLQALDMNNMPYMPFGTY